MQTISKEELNALLQNQTDPCVSIFMPVKRTGPEIRPNAIQLKDLIREAEEKLVRSGLSISTVEKILAPANDFLNDIYFWKQPGKGLAIFASSLIFRSYFLPVHFQPLSMVGPRFQLKQIIPMVQRKQSFYVLAMSQKSVRFFQCDFDNITEVVVPGVPKDLAEAMKYTDPEKQLQLHTSSPKLPGTREAAISHGSGSGIDDEKENLLEFFRQIDRGLHPFLKDKSAPLIVACVESLFSIYKKRKSYAHLGEAGISGNPDLLSPKELHERAWEIVSRDFRNPEKEARIKYINLATSGHASQDLAEIIQSSSQGRVESVFVTTNRNVWGKVDSEKGLLVHAEPQPGDEDLLNLIALQVFQSRGAVYAMESEDSSAPAARAIFRT